MYRKFPVIVCSGTEGAAKRLDLPPVAKPTPAELRKVNWYSLSWLNPEFHHLGEGKHCRKPGFIPLKEFNPPIMVGLLNS
jgi:hypothetical protein